MVQERHPLSQHIVDYQYKTGLMEWILACQGASLPFGADYFYAESERLLRAAWLNGDDTVTFAPYEQPHPNTSLKGD